MQLIVAKRGVTIAAVTASSVRWSARSCAVCRVTCALCRTIIGDSNDRNETIRNVVSRPMRGPRVSLGVAHADLDAAVAIPVRDRGPRPGEPLGGVRAGAGGDASKPWLHRVFQCGHPGPERGFAAADSEVASCLPGRPAECSRRRRRVPWRSGGGAEEPFGRRPRPDSGRSLRSHR